MKRFVAVGFSCILVMSSCSLTLDHELDFNKEKGGTITLSINEPINIETKATALDTNNYYLSIKNVSGENIYTGKYGERPSEISVKSGTYEISVVSTESVTPSFDAPRYGDTKTIIVSNGENVNVSLLCKQINSGIRLIFLEKFIEKYPDSYVVISQTFGKINYQYSETRYSFFEKGNAQFSIVNDIDTTVFLNKVLDEGVNLTIYLDASSNESKPSFNIEIDTTAKYISENIVVGDKYLGEDGVTPESAYCVESAKEHIGETIWVWGYITAGYNSTSASSISFNPPFTSASSMAISSSLNVQKPDECISVTLASGSQIRTEANLVDNPHIFGKKIFIKGTIVESYLGLIGIKPVKEFSW